MQSAPQTTVAELKGLMDAGAPPCLLDVREDWEVAIARLPGSVHIPLNEIPRRLKELDAASAIIVVCKSGGRSQMAADYLLRQGVSRVSNLRGGIDAWVRDIDPNLPAY
jgi:adenylyltransferase/sulfurtransferase